MVPREQATVLVVGAGPGGLAAAACLTRARVPHVVVEASDSVAPRWRAHYERLHLHTPKRLSGLPYRPMPKTYPVFPSRQQLVDYLADYAEHFAIEPRFGERVTSVRQEEGEWVVSSERARYQAQHVVMATGYNHLPVRPSWPGQDTFQGELVHSSEYRSGKKYAGRSVLVVGVGNTGAELAIDLVEQGAREVYLCVRGPVDVIPREFLGISIVAYALVNQHLPLGVQDALTRTVSRISLGALDGLGLVGTGKPMSRIVQKGRIPLIDVGTIALIREGRIKVVGAIERFDETGVLVGGHLALDAVVLATGYRSGLGELIANSAQVLDDRGLPRHVTGDLPGLHFVGFRNPPTGFLRSIAHDARKVARAISRATG